jgi:DNA-binding SARP family transcriptional activator/tetratricopeptide (TPR) repeat protein
MSSTSVSQLQRHLSAVLQKSPGQVLGLWGEAGVGKSFLLETLLAETPCKHLRVHSGMSVAEIVKGLPAASNLPAWAKNQLEQLQRGQTLNSQALGDTLVVTLSALAPFILVFEDLHDASSERLELILNMAKVIPRIRGVGLIASSRALLPEPFRSYRLEALDRIAADALLEAQAKSALPPEAKDWVYAKAQGNALFTLEFWRYLLRLGAFWSDGERWQWRKPEDDFVPVSIEALILDLLDSRMTVQSRRVLEVRALLEQLNVGIAFEIWADVAKVSLEVLSASIAELQTLGVLQDSRFAHPLFHEVLTREIPSERLQGYRLAAIGALEKNQPEQAAMFLEGLSLKTENAIALLKAAQTSAEARGDKIAALKWLARIVEFLDEPERTRQALEAARAMVGFQIVQAQKLAAIAASGANPSPEAVVFYAEVLARLGHSEQAELLLEAQTGMGLDQFQTLILIKQLQGHSEKVMQLWNAHLELQPLVDTYTMSHICFSLVRLSRLTQAQQLLEVMIARNDQDFKSLYYLHNSQMIIYGVQSNYPKIFEASQKAIKFADQYGQPSLKLQSLRNHAVMCRNMGRFMDARETLSEALELSLQLGDARRYATLQDSMASILYDEGRFEEAETLYTEVQKMYTLYDLHPSSCDNHLDQANLYLDWQPTSGIPLALRHARAGLQLARGMDVIYFLTRALELTARAEALSRNPNQALVLAQELQALAQLHPNEKDRSLLTLGFALEANGRQHEARESFLQSEAEYKRNELDANAERAGLEADRLTSDVQSAKKRHAWFLAQGLLGDAKVALRYFPEINAFDCPSSSASETTEPSLRLNVLGMAQLERDGQKIVYRGKKRLELLCYLLEARMAGRNEVSALELAEVFYPDHSDKDAKHTLRQQIYLIRNELGQQIIHSTTNGYALQDISSDAELFFSTFNTRLWRGVYLERMSEGWDGNISESLTQALRSGFERLLETDLSEAARIGEILLTMQPYDAELLYQVLQGHQRAGLTKSAMRLYAEALERFWGVHESLPQRLEDFLNTKLEPRVLTASPINNF